MAQNLVSAAAMAYRWPRRDGVIVMERFRISGRRWLRTVAGLFVSTVLTDDTGRRALPNAACALRTGVPIGRCAAVSSPAPVTTLRREETGRTRACLFSI